MSRHSGISGDRTRRSGHELPWSMLSVGSFGNDNYPPQHFQSRRQDHTSLLESLLKTFISPRHYQAVVVHCEDQQSADWGLRKRELSVLDSGPGLGKQAPLRAEDGRREELGSEHIIFGQHGSSGRSCLSASSGPARRLRGKCSTQIGTSPQTLRARSQPDLKKHNNRPTALQLLTRSKRLQGGSAQ